MTYRSKAHKRYEGQLRSLKRAESLLAYYEEHAPHEEKAIHDLKNTIRFHPLS